MELDQARVLIVEDDASLRSILARALADAGLVVEVAADGLEALQCVERRPPAVILLDVCMPNLDGYAFMDACQPIIDLWQIKIVVATADRRALARARELHKQGVAAMLPKPFELDALISVVHGLARGHAAAGARR